MQLDTFVIRLVLLALPGVLAQKVYRKLRGPTAKELWESFLEILLFALSSYVVLGLLHTVFHVPVGSNQLMPTTQTTLQPYVIQSVFDPALPLDWFQIAYACLISLALAASASWLHKHKVVNRVGLFCRISNRVADEDLWELYFDTPNIKWVLVRDHKHALAYFGAVRYVSDSGEERELVLEHVDVYNNDDGQKLYGTSAIYLSLDKGDVSIQLPEVAVETPAQKGAANAKE